MATDSLINNLDRQVIKAIVIPLIYGILLYFKVKQRKQGMVLQMICKIFLEDTIYTQRIALY
jgi:hypothetical protein